MSKLETLLQSRRLDHTLIRPWLADAPARVTSSGHHVLDESMAGGWRLGEVSELVGAATSGRTHLAVTSLAAATAAGRLAALIDTTDRFDPRTAAEAGADLTRLLWVRGPALSPGSARPAVVDRAVRQAVRACDLVVRAGGFAVVVLDLADVPARLLRWLPHPTWLRLARALDGQPTACLLVAPVPLGRSARGITVQVSARPQWRGESRQSRRLTGLDVTARFQTAHAIVDAINLNPRTLAPSHLRTFAPSHPRTSAPSHPRTFEPPHPRTFEPFAHPRTSEPNRTPGPQDPRTI